ncbi:MAG: PocR ligand-binding domain-containing protein [Deltaproteobacteria bacterium]|nr:PocR ligand-binding domain-containing protein [Deltaproteobacteria bacterium]
MSGAPISYPAPPRLEDVVAVEQLRQLASSCAALLGVPLRLFSASGALLAESGGERELCALVSESAAGRQACRAVVGRVRREAVEALTELTVPCFTSACYDIVPVLHQQERIASLVLGPYRVHELGARSEELPASLIESVSDIARSRARHRLLVMPKLTAETAKLWRSHVRLVVELLVESGYQALVTSRMHVAAIRESFRELEHKNAELQDALDRFRDVDELRNSFLSTMSHELRTPLTSIIGYGDMLLRGMAGPLSERQREYLETIRRQGDQLLGLIRSLLTMAKLEDGSMPVNRRRTGVLPLLEEVVEALRPLAAAKDVSFQVGADGGAQSALDAWADPDRLRQVLLNIADNAVRFSPQGGQVTLRAAQIEHVDEDIGFVLFAPLHRRVEVRIADQGPGVPRHARTRVFDPFYQIDHSSTRTHSGAGLGLAIAKRLVEAHAGTIHVEDGEPAGAVFVVRVPAWDEGK